MYTVVYKYVSLDVWLQLCEISIDFYNFRINLILSK